MNKIKDFNTSNIRWFVVVGEGLEKVNRGGSISFRQYTDHEGALGKGEGFLAKYVTSKDAKQQDVGKWFQMDESRRRFQVRANEQDIYGITQYEFLKNYPDCEGSPNGRYVIVDGTRIQEGVLFRELDTNKDAAVALEAESRRTEAQASALKLDSATLQEVAAVIGVFGEPGELMKLKVLEFAGKRPGDYFSVLNAGDRNVRAIVRKAVADGYFRTKGTVLYWEDTLIGADEDAAVTTLLKDKMMLDALQKKVDLKTDAKATLAKNKGGRPAGSKNKSKADEKTPPAETPTA